MKCVFLASPSPGRDAGFIEAMFGGDLSRSEAYTARFDEWFEDEELDARVDAIQAQILELWRRSVVHCLETARADARAGTRNA